MSNSTDKCFVMKTNAIAHSHCEMQEVWKVSTTAGSKRVKKGSAHEASASSSHTTKENEVPSKSSVFTSSTSQADSTQVSYLKSLRCSFSFCSLFVQYIYVGNTRNPREQNKSFEVFFIPHPQKKSDLKPLLSCG